MPAAAACKSQRCGGAAGVGGGAPTPPGGLGQLPPTKVPGEPPAASSSESEVGMRDASATQPRTPPMNRGPSWRRLRPACRRRCCCSTASTSPWPWPGANAFGRVAACQPQIQARAAHHSPPAPAHARLHPATQHAPALTSSTRLHSISTCAHARRQPGCRVAKQRHAPGSIPGQGAGERAWAGGPATRTHRWVPGVLLGGGAQQHLQLVRGRTSQQAVACAAACGSSGAAGA